MKLKVLGVVGALLLLFANFTHAQDVRGVESIGIDDICVIEIAPNGDIWAGSNGDGVAFYNAANLNWTYYNTGNTPQLLSDSITSFVNTQVAGNSRTYIGTASGAYYIDAVAGFSALPNVTGTRVEGVAYRRDSVWAVTVSNLVLFDSNNVFQQTMAAPLPAVTCVQQSLSCSGFWAGTANNGVFYTENGTNFIFIDTSAPNKKLVDNRVNTIAVDNNCQAIFVGTQGGFSMCPLGGPPCQNFTTANSALPQNNIVDIATGCAGQVWLATRDSGVVVFQNQTFTRITTANGLPSNNITAINAIPATCYAYAATPGGDITVMDSAKTVQEILSGIQFTGANNLAVTVFPQPASSELTFNFGNVPVTADLRITDIGGRTVMQTRIEGSSAIVDVSQLGTGMYFYTLQADNAVVGMGRITVQ
jgi:ligand-binding sensor domain-containing protein